MVHGTSENTVNGLLQNGRVVATFAQGGPQVKQLMGLVCSVGQECWFIHLGEQLQVYSSYQVIQQVNRLSGLFIYVMCNCMVLYICMYGCSIW